MRLANLKEIGYICAVIKDKVEIKAIKEQLLSRLKAEHAFWSYEPESINATTVSDERLIALTMRYLDIDEIKQLFTIFSFNKVKHAWKKLLIPEGEYLYTLNRFFAWYYFKAKNPDAYVKSLATRHLNKMTAS